MSKSYRSTEGQAFQEDREDAARMLSARMGYSFSWGCALWLARCFAGADWRFLPTSDLEKVKLATLPRLKQLAEIVLE